MGSYLACSTDFRASAPEPNAGCTTTCGAAMLGYALANSTPGNNSPQPEYHKAASRDPNSSSTVWMMCCAAWTTSILPPHSCTLATSHLLPQVRTSMPVLRQCNLPCPLYRHGLPSTASKSKSIRVKLLYSKSFYTHGLKRTWPISILAMGTYVFSHAQCAYWAARLIDFLILARTLPPLQSGPRHAAISCGWPHRPVRPITPCDPFRLNTSTVCHCIVARQLSHASPPLTSIICKYCTATAVKHPLALEHQRKTHLSTWKSIFSRSKRYSGFLHSHNTNAIYASMITRICVPLSTLNLCRHPCMGKRRHQSRFREMSLLMDYNASV
ncbi:hypothetical protein ECC02_010688 [Trypanosoma cruzi]|uniref:Uncharacterized protein n=1 Tax=Trypanosoma cruzi TaxID=5693 RepID=A0A7J6XQ15_TRYCR|nr:hypothetical protein ECC02_010688 [Trypanosoma cruzi]